MERGPGHRSEPMDRRARDPAVGRDAKKKSLAAAERDEQARTAYRERGAARAVPDVVVVDECGSTINLTPISARAPRGMRAYGQVPRTTEKNTTLIASLMTTGMGPAMVLEGTTDTAAFDVSVEQVLAPELRPGQVVVMGNLSAHTSERVRTLIEARSCERWFLPASSPDVLPIEEAFSKLKALVRRAEARTREALVEAIATALERITPFDAQGYFRHGGYGTQAQ